MDLVFFSCLPWTCCKDVVGRILGGHVFWTVYFSSSYCQGCVFWITGPEEQNQQPTQCEEIPAAWQSEKTSP